MEVGRSLEVGLYMLVPNGEFSHQLEEEEGKSCDELGDVSGM